MTTHRITDELSACKQACWDLHLGIFRSVLINSVEAGGTIQELLSLGTMVRDCKWSMKQNCCYKALSTLRNYLYFCLSIDFLFNSPLSWQVISKLEFNSHTFHWSPFCSPEICSFNLHFSSSHTNAKCRVIQPDLNSLLPNTPFKINGNEMKIFSCPKGEYPDRLIICKANLYLENYYCDTHTWDSTDYCALLTLVAYLGKHVFLMYYKSTYI